MYRKRETIEKALIILTDLICTIISIVIAFYIRYHLLLGIAGHGDQLWLLFVMLGVCILVNLMSGYDYHFSRRDYFKELQVIIKKQAVFSITLILLLYVMHRANILSENFTEMAVGAAVVNGMRYWVQVFTG